MSKFDLDLNKDVLTNGFHLGVETDSHLLWFCITMHSDWLKNRKKLAPLSKPVRSKTKTNRVSPTHVFPRFLPATCISIFVWFTGLSMSFVIDQSDNFDFGFTTLNQKWLYLYQYIQQYTEWMCTKHYRDTLHHISTFAKNVAFALQNQLRNKKTG